MPTTDRVRQLFADAGIDIPAQDDWKRLKQSVQAHGSYPAPYMSNENREYYQDAYEVGYEKIIDSYAA